MKKIVITLVTIVALICANLAVFPAMAAKPFDVIQHSNGFPSGQHFNLNLHGRDCTTWTGDYTGNAVVIPLYSSLCGDATIEYLSNKKNTHKTELYVVDPLTEPFDGNSAQVYLPYNIDDDGDPATPTISAGGYYVFGRILGKPNNGSSDDQSSLLLYPNSLVAASNSENTSWPWYSDNVTIDDHIYLDMGVITSNGQVGVTDPSGFYRFDPPTDDPNEKGKGNKTGKSKAVEITQLFLWSGFVSDNLSLDADGSGTLNITDLQTNTSDPTIRAEWLPFEAEWLDEIYYQDQFDHSAPAPNGEVDDQEEFIAWLHWLSLGDYGVSEYENAWIFDVAEMVISGQQVENDGTKNFQIRFYPVATTEFGDHR
jgi:hypothetical protein